MIKANRCILIKIRMVLYCVLVSQHVSVLEIQLDKFYVGSKMVMNIVQKKAHSATTG